MTEVKSGIELKENLLIGINKLNNAVSSTLGPFGRTVLIRDEYGNMKPTKDGVSVAKAFKELEDEVENYGVQMVKKVSMKTANEAGDGTTTSTLLATKMIQDGFNEIKKGSNAVEVKKGIDDGVSQVLKFLKSNKLDITEDSQIKEVATISGNGDPEIGNLIATALDKVGRDGVVAIEKSKSGETILDVVEGMQFDQGYKSPYFVTDNNTMTCSLENPLILIYDGRLTAANDVVGVMNKANFEDKPLIIIAEDIDGEALSTLVVNKMRGIVNSVAIKSPEFGDRRTAILEDIALITGGQVISTKKGVKLDKLSQLEFNSYLGNAKLVTISKEKTTIVDGKCEEGDLVKRADEIKTQIDNTQSSYEKEKLQERLGRLVGGVAVISVGGNSELEIDEKKDRVEDALFATKSALEEGILPGGGIALLRASNEIVFSTNKNIELGQKIVYSACVAPIITILENAGYEVGKIDEILSQLKHKPNFWEGYDLKSESFVDMKDRGILDPFKVTRCSLINASSVAGTILTSNNLVYEKRIVEVIQNQQEY